MRTARKVAKSNWDNMALRSGESSFALKWQSIVNVRAINTII